MVPCVRASSFRVPPLFPISFVDVLRGGSRAGGRGTTIDTATTATASIDSIVIGAPTVTAIIHPAFINPDTATNIGLNSAINTHIGIDIVILPTATAYGDVALRRSTLVGGKAAALVPPSSVCIALALLLGVQGQACGIFLAVEPHTLL